ncbi:unnamed protein product [Gadus morhua 'NCC']
METDVDVGNLENMPLQTCDVGTQWPDLCDHNYSGFSSGNKRMKDCGTQTDQTPQQDPAGVLMLFSYEGKPQLEKERSPPLNV